MKPALHFSTGQHCPPLQKNGGRKGRHHSFLPRPRINYSRWLLKPGIELFLKAEFVNKEQRLWPGQDVTLTMTMEVKKRPSSSPSRRSRPASPR